MDTMLTEREEQAVDYLSRSDVAHLLGVSANTVARWAREGRIPCHRTLGGHRRFSRSVVEQLLQRMRADGPVSIDRV
jgi:excisionase family DNA binding protein